MIVTETAEDVLVDLDVAEILTDRVSSTAFDVALVTVLAVQSVSSDGNGTTARGSGAHKRQ